MKIYVVYLKISDGYYNFKFRMECFYEKDQQNLAMFTQNKQKVC